MKNFWPRKVIVTEVKDLPQLPALPPPPPTQEEYIVLWLRSLGFDKPVLVKKAVRRE